MPNQALINYKCASNLGTSNYQPEQATILDQVAASYCLHPVEVTARHYYKPLSFKTYAPCKQCEQCRNTYGNELTSRFFQDYTILKHAYFITLTYPSYALAKNVPQSLAPCCYVRDSNNASHKSLLSPCLLYYPHVSSYNKLLRTRLTREFGECPTLEIITTGELGHSYGRPHWHQLILSSHKLTKQQIQKSWIDTLKINHARIDFQDLTSNGTMYAREDLSNPTKDNRNIKLAVKYVVKYTRKDSFEFANLYRLRLVVPFLSNPDIDMLYDNDHVCLKNRYIFDKLNRLTPQTPNAYGNYESKQTQHFDSVEDIDLLGYYGLFGTHHQLSTSNAIGKLYALANLSRFASGNRKIVPIPTRTATMHLSQSAGDASLKPCTETYFPSYYSALLKRYRLPFSTCRKTVQNRLQCAVFTLQDYHTLLSFWHENSHLFINDSYVVPRGTIRPLSPEDLPQFICKITDSQCSLLFPDKTAKALSRYTNDIDQYKETFFRYGSMRIYLGFIPETCKLAFYSIEYDRDLRYWTSPMLLPFEFFYEKAYLPLMAFRAEYDKIYQSSVETHEVVSALLHSPYWLDAIDKCRENWRDFKKNKNQQTKQRNKYD